MTTNPAEPSNWERSQIRPDTLAERWRFMDIRSALPGLSELQRASLGDPDVCVAVLDGPVDLSHPCFAGAALQRLDTLVQEAAGSGRMSMHGTHVASMLFGQPGSPMMGIAPRCRGLIVPIFEDEQPGPVSQLDLARAIEQAVQAGAHIVSVSGGERSATGDPDSWLDHALKLCNAHGVLLVAAVGNDGCACLQVPAAVPSVLAVGASGTDGRPLQSSNWGEPYLLNGVLAPGENIDGAIPGGATASLTGSSFATPFVSGVAALLLCFQRSSGWPGDTLAIRDAIVGTATPCQPRTSEQCLPYLAGCINVSGAYELVRKGGTKAVTTPKEAPVPPSAAETLHAAAVEPTGVEPSAENPARSEPHSAGAEVATPQAPQASPDTPALTPTSTPALEQSGIQPPPAENNNVGRGQPPVAGHAQSQYPTAVEGHRAQDGRPGVVAAGDCGCGGGGDPGTAPNLVYAIGKIGYDFGTEARRDGFRQQMPSVDTHIVDDEQSPPSTVFGQIPPNPYNPFEMSAYLKRNPWAANKLIWTLNLERTPIYALEAEVPYGMDWGQPILDQDGNVTGADLQFPPVAPVYKTFRDAIVGQALDPDHDRDYISMVSVPGILTSRTVRLFTGQVLPVVVVSTRGMYSWNEPELVEAAVGAVQEDADRQRRAGRSAPTVDDFTVRQNIRAFLDKVYFQFRNLGQSPPDRALNYAATNAFMVADTLREGFTSGTYVPGQNVGLYSLDTIGVTKSPYCRLGSDCWDVSLTFFDPENERRARVTYLFTIDVIDELPVSLAPSHRFLVGTPQLEGHLR